MTTGKLGGKAQAPVDAAKRAKDAAEKKAKDAVDKAKVDAGLTQPDGQPTLGNPTLSEALPGPAPIGVPNFFIDKFRIPPFLLPVYQAAGIEYGVRWEILAAINEIETDYGRNLNVSSAGAVGWMQFMPETWAGYGVDANGDGVWNTDGDSFAFEVSSPLWRRPWFAALVLGAAGGVGGGGAALNRSRG